MVSARRWNASVLIAAQAGTWIITMFVVRLLPPAHYGLMSLAEVVLGLCFLVNELGAVPALVQRQQIDDRLVRQTFGLVLTTNTALYVIAFLGAAYLADFFWRR
jgi:teichuronic acid exporter